MQALGGALQQLPARAAPRPRGNAARGRRGADGHGTGRARPTHPAYLRTVVYRGWVTFAPDHNGIDPAAVSHRLLLDPGYTVEDVALKLGYSKTKTLQMHLRAVFGVTAGEAPVSLSTEEALMTVTDRYLKPMTQAAS